jgi:hypothetical protein
MIPLVTASETGSSSACESVPSTELWPIEDVSDEAFY